MEDTLGLNRSSGMEKKPRTYEGKISPLESRKILLDINELENGHYELVLIHKGLPLKRVFFKKL